MEDGQQAGACRVCPSSTPARRDSRRPSRGRRRADRHSRGGGGRRPDAGRLPPPSAEGCVTPRDRRGAACTLQLQGLAGRELTELAVGQGELVPLELQRDRGLGLGHSTRRPREGSQLGYFDDLPTCGNAEEKEMSTLEESVRLRH